MNADTQAVALQTLARRIEELIAGLELEERVVFIEVRRVAERAEPPRLLGAPRVTLPRRPAPELLSCPVVPPRPVLPEELEGGSLYRVHVGWRDTGLSVDLRRWPGGLKTDADAREALALVETELDELRGSASNDLDAVVRRVPESLAQLYSLRMDPRNQQLTINPSRLAGRAALRSRGVGLTVSPTAQGGRRIGLARPDGSPAKFEDAEWTRMRLAEAITSSIQAHHGLPGTGACKRVALAGYDLDLPRDLLRVRAEGTPEPIYFALSSEPERRGMVSVCSQVEIFDFDSAAHAGPLAIRKPVIYFWPLTRVELRVELRTQGRFIAQYPKHNAGHGCWSLVATPDGMLHEPGSGRSFAYLFWEAEGHGLELDLAQAHCVPGDKAAAFLERVAAAYELNVKERSDFVSYWLPALEANPYSLVQLLDAAAYAAIAQLRVTPEPDTLIRLFMIFRRSEAPRPVGAPALPSFTRAGFCVLEWGGVNLDEGGAPRALGRGEARP